MFVCLDVRTLDLNHVFNLLSLDEKEEVLKYRFEKDRKLKAGGFLVLKYLFNKSNIENPIVDRTKLNKPFLRNHEDIHFNLSYSNYMVFGAIGNSPIGIDIEYIGSNVNLDISKHFFTEKENNNILNSDSPSEEFFKYWTLKEAYLKYLGTGLQKSLDSFDLNQIKHLLSSISLDDYKIGVCYKNKIKKEDILFIKDYLNIV